MCHVPVAYVVLPMLHICPYTQMQKLPREHSTRTSILGQSSVFSILLSIRNGMGMVWIAGNPNALHPDKTQKNHVVYILKGLVCFFVSVSVFSFSVSGKP
jgi:hypothetical protein